MMFMPYYFFFFMTLMLGSFMSISSLNWIYVWMGLEVNLLSFVPIVISISNDMETESVLKYYLVQAFGSSFILMGSFSLMNFPNSMISEEMSIFFLVFSLMVKMGMAPFHFWLPHVMGGVGWLSCMLLAVWQKMAPIFVMSSMAVVLDRGYLLLLGGLGSLIGGVGGLNQTQLRVLLAYSSIGHMGWMLVAMCSSFSLLVVYYLVYSFITLSIMWVMYYISLKMVNLMSFGMLPGFMVLFLCVMFLSLGGLPPFLGFYPKWMVMQEVMGGFNFISMGMLISGSLMNIFYYLNVFFNVFMKSIYEGLVSVVMYNGEFSYIVFTGTVMLASISTGMVYMCL